MNRKCWCGNQSLIEFSPDYFLCPDCGTLVSQKRLDAQENLIHEDAYNFYGENYFTSHQSVDFNYPDIFYRTRSDLSERCLYWLKTFLKYQLPPADVLELGCANGSFIALLKQVGYGVAGLEISDWVVDYVRKTFDIQILKGPLEHQTFSNQSLDSIIMMDVLEHLPDPLGTLLIGKPLLRTHGILLIQTPCFPEEKTYSELVKEKHPFLKMLQPDEHLFLFSQRSIRILLGKIGISCVQFEQPLFVYDMFFVAGACQPQIHAEAEINSVLQKNGATRMVQALLDLWVKNQELYQKLLESEEDRKNRLEVIQQLNNQLNKTNLFKNMMMLNFLHSPKKPPAEKKREKKNDKGFQIAIDLTPVLPGGDNGGAKVFVLELIQALAVLRPHHQFILLTSPSSHEELAFLETHNIKRYRIQSSDAQPPLVNWACRAAKRLMKHKKICRMLPISWAIHLFYNRMPSLLKKLSVDLLFCPFTAPFFHTVKIPVVSIVYDLQYCHYPEFFSEEEGMQREINFKKACQVADRLICISEYTRVDILNHSDLLPEMVKTILIRLSDRLPSISSLKRQSILEFFHLEANNFLFYPANFWAHKNHDMLLVAFAMYRLRYPDSRLKLVCTGAYLNRYINLINAVKKMNLESWVIFPGYISNEQFSALLASCKALIFPSLYEGFGMPLLEAMQKGRPVLCSRVTSLPEVGGDAALYFDPRKPETIVTQIRTLEENRALVAELIEKGKARAKQFSDVKLMAEEYGQIFDEVLSQTQCPRDTIKGIYEDHWIGRQLRITFSQVNESHIITLKLAAPDFIPMSKINIQVVLVPSKQKEKYTIKRGEELILTFSAPKNINRVDIFFTPVFQPVLWGIAQDQRELSCQMKKYSCELQTK